MKSSRGARRDKSGRGLCRVGVVAVVLLVAAMLSATTATTLSASHAYASDPDAAQTENGPPDLLNWTLLTSGKQCPGLTIVGASVPAAATDIYGASCAQLASLEDFEEQAVDNLINDHQFATGDYDVVLSYGRQDAMAELWSLFEEAFQTPAGNTLSGDPVITAGDVENVDAWMSSVLQREATLDADDAALEYVKWAGLGSTAWEKLVASNPTENQLETFLSQPPEPYQNGEGPDTPQSQTSGEGYCVYSAPAPDQSQWTNNIYTNPGIKNTADASCYGGSGEIGLGSLQTPTLQDFQTWGEADLSQQVYGNTDFAAGATGTALGSILLAVADTAGPLIGAGVAAATASAVVPLSFALSVVPYGVEAAGIQSYFVGANLYAEGVVGDEVLEALESAAIWEAATGIGAVVGAAIFAVTTAVQEGVSVVNASQLPGQLASAISTATPGESLSSLNSDPTAAQGLYTLLVGAEGPPPTSSDCANPYSGGLFAVSFPIGATPCLNATPIPAQASGDPQWIITPTDGSGTYDSPNLTWENKTDSLTTTAYLSGNWMVDTATAPGYPAETTETDRFVYTDWQGNLHTAWVYDDNSTPGFVSVLNSAVTTGFDPATCADAGTCQATPTIQAVDGDGNDITVGVTGSARDTSSPLGPPAPAPAGNGGLGDYLSVTASSNPGVGQPTTISAELYGVDSQGDSEPLHGAGGTVTFSDSYGTLCSDVPATPPPDSQGFSSFTSTSTCKVSFPADGPVPVTATYSGAGEDSTDNLSSVPPATGDVIVTVVPDTFTLLRASPQVAEFGTPVSFGATVNVAGDNPGVAPGGTVSFNLVRADTSQPLCVNLPLTTVNPFTATCTVTPRFVWGNYTVTTQYSGDAQTGSSQSTTSGQIVPSSTTTTLMAGDNAPVVGQPDPLTATVAVNPADTEAAPPTGTVDFNVSGSGTVCSDVPLTATLRVSGDPYANGSIYTATCDWTPTESGGAHVTATYGGDYDTAASPQSHDVNVVVGQASTSTSVTVAPSGASDGRVSLSATVTALAPDTGLPVDGGSVTFTNGTRPICAANLSSGTATCTSPPLVTGEVLEYDGSTITGTYRGDRNFSGSAGQATLNTTLSISPSDPSPTVGEVESYTATVTPSVTGGSPPTGTVSFIGLGSRCVSLPLSTTAPYTATCTAPVEALPTTTVGATYSGDPTNDPSTGSLTLAVGRAVPSMSLGTTDGSPVVGEAVTYTATVGLPGTGTLGPAPTGAVTFTDGTTTLCDDVALSSTAPYTASCATTWQAPSTSTVVAAYSGDSNTTTGSADEAVVVRRAGTSLKMAATNGSPTSGVGAAVVTATVVPTPPSSDGPAPTGTVTFSLDGHPLGSPVVVSGDRATAPDLSGLAPGEHTVAATYSGDRNYAGSASGQTGSVTLHVAPAPVSPPPTRTAPGGNDCAFADASVGIASAPNGYFVVDESGQVCARGAVTWHGDMSGGHLNAPIIAITATPDGGGYWLLGADGGIFTFGDAHFYGSTGGVRLNAPVVGMAVTADNKGYWIVAKDGGVFTFGDAKFHGSTGSLKLNKPVVGIAVAPGGNGYWLVASDGGVFTFTPDGFYGSHGGAPLNKPVVGMSSTPSGRGYTLVASDGGVFTYNAPFYGSLGSTPPATPIVDLSPAPADNGYYLVDSGGDVFTFGPGAAYGGGG